MSGAFAVDYFLDEEDIEEDDDDDIVPYFSSTCIRRDRVPSVRTFYEEVLPDRTQICKNCKTTRETNNLNREACHGRLLVFV